MLGKTDLRLVLVNGPTRVQTSGYPDKGYVLHFIIDQDHKAFIDRSTYVGSIYPEDYDNQSMDLDKLYYVTHTKKNNDDDELLPARWLHGPYRLNDQQVDVTKPYTGNRYIAIFEHGLLKEITPDYDKTNFNPPLMDFKEIPHGGSYQDFKPQYVYYKTDSEKHLQVPAEVANKEWRDKLLKTIGQEPFLDQDCVTNLKDAWLSH